MRALSCTRCGGTVFFDNTVCTRCDAALGFDPAALRMEAVGADAEHPPPWCANREQFGSCNWLVDDRHASGLCRSCRLNGLIPDLARPEALERWRHFQQAQRRLVHDLLRLGLAPAPRQDESQGPGGLVIHTLAPEPGGAPVVTGHDAGVVTLNLVEADDVEREAARAAFNEPWRSLLGHLRHEVSHYLQYRWVLADPGRLQRCRAAFGDETQDYAAALERHHGQGPPADWQRNFISAYASAHPFEDWAETCAHCLLVRDAVETARAWGFATADELSGDFRGLLLRQWLPLAQFLNAMNRSLGLKDSYPFLLPDPVVEKMALVDGLLREAAAEAAAGPKMAPWTPNPVSGPT